MTYGLNFPAMHLPYFYQANKMLSSQQPPHSVAHSPFSPQDANGDANCSDPERQASPRERKGQAARGEDSAKGQGRPQEEDVQVD